LIYFGLNYEELKESSIAFGLTKEEYHELRIDRGDYFLSYPLPYLWDFFINLPITAFRIISGVLIGIIPVIMLILDGIQTGSSVLMSLIEDSVLGFVFNLLALISRMIVAIVSSTLGLALFLSIIKSKKRLKNFTQTLRESLIVFLTLLLPLLLLASIFQWLSIIYYF